eukprot:g149.t1
MSDVLLEALSALYHSTDSESKKHASEWLESWRLNSEAWSISDSILHSSMYSIEVLLFCAQTLVVKIQQDFEELTPDDLHKLRESLIQLLLKFGQDPNHVIIRTQIALALAAYCAHAPGAFWHPKTCIQWLVSKLTQQPDTTSISCLIELLVVIPEESTNRRIGLHPTRKKQYRQELQDEFLTILEVLENYSGLITPDQNLKVLGNWFALCHTQVFQSILPRLVPFVHLALNALHKTESNFTPAVNTVVDLMSLVQSDSVMTVPEVKEFLEYLADSVLKLLPKFRQNLQEDYDAQVAKGLAQLFCELALTHEELIFARTQTSAALLDAILSVTSHPDYDIHSFAFEFWEKFSFSVNSYNELEYFSETFKRLLPVLLNLAKLPEEYLEMSVRERRAIDRRAIWDAFLDTITVLGPNTFLTALINNLLELNSKPNPNENWREIEALLYAIKSVHGRCKSCRDQLAGPLFNTLGTVPDHPVLQSAMLRCLDYYSPWLPTLVHQSRTDPLYLLLPVIFKNLATKETSSSAVKAFHGVCGACTSHLEGYIPQLMELHDQIILAADVSHKWKVETEPSVILSESEALDVLSALVNGISGLESNELTIPVLTKISHGLIQSIRTTFGQTSLTSKETQEKLVILITRLKEFFNSCKNSEFSAQLLHEVMLDLLPIADQMTFCHEVVEEVCGCLREGVKSSGESCQNDIDTLTVSLPPLFAKSYHCGYLYISGEIAKIFGKQENFSPRINQFIIDLLVLVCAKLKIPENFQNDPNLVDDAFLMATRVVHYCPDAIFNDEMMLMQILDTATKGILVHHEDACRSVLSFLCGVLDHHYPANPDFIKNALTVSNRGLIITKILLAGIVGGLTGKVLDSLSDTLYSISSWSERLKLGWLNGSLHLIPEQVLCLSEKKTFTEDFKSAMERSSKRSFHRVADDLSNICCRNRVSRLASQRALLPEELQYFAR